MSSNNRRLSGVDGNDWPYKLDALCYECGWLSYAEYCTLVGRDRQGERLGPNNAWDTMQFYLFY